MIEFVDPRTSPEPPSQVSREPAAHGEDLRELVRLCWAGRVYEIERWILQGRPIQAVNYKRFKKPPVVTPLRNAVRRDHRDLVLLLLCNGYRLELEPEHWNSLLDEALGNSSFEIVDLLLKWGADPTKVRPESVFETYKTELIDRFWRAGLDYTVDPGFPAYLASTVNKPLYGWLRRNRSEQRLQDVLDVALLEAVEKDHELPVNLLLWAGADPHRKVPPIWALGDAAAWADECLSSSAEAAISWGRHQMLDLLRVKEMLDLDAQLARADDLTTLKWLVALRPPSDWSEVILNFAHRLCWRHSSARYWDARYALRFAEQKGGRLTTISSDEIRRLRSELLDARDADDFLWLMKWLKKEKNCDRAIYFELTRTRAVQQKLAALTAGDPYLTPSQKMSRANERRRRRMAERAKNEPSEQGA